MDTSSLLSWSDGTYTDMLTGINYDANGNVLDGSYSGASSPGPAANNSNAGPASNNFNWGSLGNSLFSSAGSVLTQALKNQSAAAAAGAQAKVATAKASSTGSIVKIAIWAVVGLAVFGIIFALIKRKKS